VREREFAQLANDSGVARKMSNRPINAASPMASYPMVSHNAACLVLVSLCLAWPLLALAQTPAQAVPVSAVPAADDRPPAITVQIAPPPISISSAMLGIAAPLGAQSAIGKPMYAEFVTEHHQSFTDGNRISRSTASCIYRDSAGRIRREAQLSVPGVTAGIAATTFITIVDHQLGYGYVLNPQEMVAHRYELNGTAPSYVAHLSAQGNGAALLSAQSASNSTTPEPAPEGSHWRLKLFTPHHNHPAQDSAATTSQPSNSNQLGSGLLSADSGITATPTMRIDQPFLAAPNPVRTENLGEQNILGFAARGTRVITTLPAGQIGNDRPIDIVSEQWFSPELELVMRSLHQDPWAGEFVTTVTKVSRGDQAAALFEIPAPYRIIDAASEAEQHVLNGHGNHPPGPAPW
jgi:hypothetical protein